MLRQGLAVFVAVCTVAMLITYGALVYQEVFSRECSWASSNPMSIPTDLCVHRNLGLDQTVVPKTGCTLSCEPHATLKVSTTTHGVVISMPKPLNNTAQEHILECTERCSVSKKHPIKVHFVEVSHVSAQKRFPFDADPGEDRNVPCYTCNKCVITSIDNRTHMQECKNQVPFVYSVCTVGEEVKNMTTVCRIGDKVVQTTYLFEHIMLETVEAGDLTQLFNMHVVKNNSSWFSLGTIFQDFSQKGPEVNAQKSFEPDLNTWEIMQQYKSLRLPPPMHVNDILGPEDEEAANVCAALFSNKKRDAKAEHASSSGDDDPPNGGSGASQEQVKDEPSFFGWAAGAVGTGLRHVSPPYAGSTSYYTMMLPALIAVSFMVNAYHDSTCVSTPWGADTGAYLGAPMCEWG